MDEISDAPPIVAAVPDGAGERAPAAPRLVPQARTDVQLLELWLFGRSPHTQRAYRREAARFLAHAGRPLREVTLGDVQAFATALAAEAAALTPASQARGLAAWEREDDAAALELRALEAGWWDEWPGWTRSGGARGPASGEAGGVG